MSIEDNNAKSYSNKSNKPNNTRISTEKKENFRHNRKKDHIVTALVGDSMVKDIYGWKISDNNEKVLVKHFSGSTTEDMMTYIKPPLKRNPDCFIIHLGTNDLRFNQDHETITRNIVEVANNSKTDTNKVLISSIVP